MPKRARTLLTRGITLAGLLSSHVAAAPAPSAEPVDTALVLAVDVSLSVDESRYALQRNGIAAAFASPEVAAAIVSGPHRVVAVAIIEFSDPDRQTIVIPWTRLADSADAEALAGRIRGIRRSSQGLTDLGDALLAARTLIETAPYRADRRIVDLSSDGMSNVGTDINAAHDAVVGDGITINGLPILAAEPWLPTYYENYVVGGPDSFVEIAHSEADFAVAMQRKLARELMLSSAASRRGTARG